MNIWIEENELNEIKEKLAEWAKDLPADYEPERKNMVSFTEKEFFTVVKRVANLEAQNKENAKLKLSDFLIGDIIWYLIENNETKAVIRVDSSHEYDIKTNFAHIHGSGREQWVQSKDNCSEFPVRSRNRHFPKVQERERQTMEHFYDVYFHLYAFR